jgi:PAS domain S-box-containing protein
LKATNTCAQEFLAESNHYFSELTVEPEIKMKNTIIKVLLVEDDEDDVFLAKTYLSEVRNFDFEVSSESDLARARHIMLTATHDVNLIDYRLGSENGLDLIRFIQSKGILTPCILLTGQGDLKVDIDASSYGAADYLVKSEINASTLERSIRYALSNARTIKTLDEKEKKYRSLFERSVDAIFLANHKLELKDLNDSFLNFFGYTKEEGKNLTIKSIFLQPEDFLSFKESLENTQQVKDFEVVLLTKSGDPKTSLLNCIFIPDQPAELCCYQGIVHDLTIRKQAEYDMLIAERLSVTGKIARTIAHEVRNPLTNLNLALDQLRDELPPTNPAIKLYGDIIERNSLRIEKLVDEMLTSSKPEKLHLELVNPREIVEGVIALAADRIKLNQVKLHVNHQPELPRILIDPNKIQIALLNIITNAIESMPLENGTLKIRTSLVDKIITIEIKDNGKGIPAANISKLFDPFFTEKHGGMGLGLTTTKNILVSHSAQIDVKSELTKGTSFYIRFKLAE